MSGIGDSGLSEMVANEKAMRNGANPPSYLSLERYQKRQRNGGGSQAKFLFRSVIFSKYGDREYGIFSQKELRRGSFTSTRKQDNTARAAFGSASI